MEVRRLALVSLAFLVLVPTASGKILLGVLGNPSRFAGQTGQRSQVGHVFLGWNYEQKGMYAEAIAQLQTAMSLSGGSRYVTPGLAHAYAAAGQKARALELLNQLRQSSERSYVDPYDIALIYAALGDKDQGFMWLEKAYWGTL